MKLRHNAGQPAAESNAGAVAAGTASSTAAENAAGWSNEGTVNSAVQHDEQTTADTVKAQRSGDDKNTGKAPSNDDGGFDVDAAATTETGADKANDGLAPPDPDEGPDSPTQLRGKGLFAAIKRTFKQFSTDNLSDWAAALTYYGVLSIFPAALVLISLVGLLGPNGKQTVQSTIRDIVGNAQIESLTNTVLNSMSNQSAAGLAAIIGIVLAFWSASGYVAAFMRASNAVYDVPEGRPIWKTLPIRVGVTAVVGVMLVASAVILVVSGKLAEIVGRLIGAGGVAVQVWSIAKWPVLIILISLMFAILYWASPNAKTGGFRWVSPGGIFAVVLWVIVSVAFAIYLATFANYAKTYGSLGSVIAFLVWLWISNIAILLGAELDAELERGRAIAAGHPADDEPFLQLRDDRKIKKGSEKGLSEG
jgi:membrane protein